MEPLDTILFLSFDVYSTTHRRVVCDPVERAVRIHRVDGRDRIDWGSVYDIACARVESYGVEEWEQCKPFTMDEGCGGCWNILTFDDSEHDACVVRAYSHRIKVQSLG